MNSMQESEAGVKTVLVVEDYADSRLMMARLLEMSGYRVVEAADGRAAVRAAERECPDVVLMDLQMPVLDGFTATSLLRRTERTRGVPVIAVSAQSGEDYVSAARLVGCDHFVAKPVDFDLLLALVGECAAGAGGRARGTAPDTFSVRQPCV